jgi:hypothetical protein
MLKNTTLLVIILALACQDIFSQNIIWNETPEQRKERMQWWTQRQVRHVYPLGHLRPACKA